MKEPSSCNYISSEDEIAIKLINVIESKYSKTDIRNIYRIIHLLLDILIKDEKYKYNSNKYIIIMICLHRFYVSYPNSHDIIQSYSVYVADKLHEIKCKMYEDRDKDRSLFCKYCVIS